MEPTKQEYQDWRDNVVTKAFFQRVVDRYEDIKELLVNEPTDRLAGYAQALRAILDTNYGDIQE